jgi:formylglycine-generating enzyme required for sulfatase activity
LKVAVETKNAIGIRLVLIPPGEFDMGETDAKVAEFLAEAKAQGKADYYVERLPSEAPKHRVRIAKPFWLSQHEITRGQFRRFVDEQGYRTEAERDAKGGEGYIGGQFNQDPSFVWNAENGHERPDDHPVVNVSPADAKAFCAWLSLKDGKETHLPTEEQWEYACRAGTATTWHSGDDAGELRQYAWFNGNAGKQTHPVGEKLPNAWGLYDMHGNVEEWCGDWWAMRTYATAPPEDPPGPAEGSLLVLRGGSWSTAAAELRASRRNQRRLDRRSVSFGFRIVVQIPSNP